MLFRSHVRKYLFLHELSLKLLWRKQQYTIIFIYMKYLHCRVVRERESLLAQTISCKNKIKALGTEKKLQNRLSRRAPLESFINFYRGLKLMAELLRI